MKPVTEQDLNQSVARLRTYMKLVEENTGDLSQLNTLLASHQSRRDDIENDRISSRNKSAELNQLDTEIKDIQAKIRELENPVSVDAPSAANNTSSDLVQLSNRLGELKDIATTLDAESRRITDILSASPPLGNDTGATGLDLQQLRNRLTTVSQERKDIDNEIKTLNAVVADLKSGVTPTTPASTSSPVTTPPAAKQRNVPKSDPNVVKLQQDLNAKGASLKVDGIMGPQTRAAMARYNTPRANASTSPPAASSQLPNGNYLQPQQGSQATANGNYSRPQRTVPQPVNGNYATQDRLNRIHGASGNVGDVDRARGAFASESVTFGHDPSLARIVGLAGL